MLSLETRSLWPPVIDHISVEKGYEKALGAALGDDLDAPVDRSSPMHWTEVTSEAGDPALPDGVEPLGTLRQGACTACASARANRGGRTRRRHPTCRALKTGQRLVSREGDLWRWDGFVAAAHAPTGAARRLAQRSRFVEIDGELASARSEVEAKRRALEAAQSAFDLASSAETETRTRERDLNRQAARLSALAEARARLNVSRDEAHCRQGRSGKRAWRACSGRRSRNEACSKCAMRSQANAPSSPRCRPNSRRLSAKPNLPIAGLRPLQLTKPVGPNASRARAIRSPRSNSALPRPSATAPNWKTHRRFLPRSAAH